MKKYILKSILLTAIASLMLVGCNNSPKEKEVELEDAQEDVIDAKVALQQSKLDSINDYNTFKNSIELKIDENQKQINEIAIKVDRSNDKNRAANVKELAKLEEKNQELKTKLNEYDQQGTAEKWELFKVEVNNDIDELGKSISNMAERNMKN
jgi:hypothetical protein